MKSLVFLLLLGACGPSLKPSSRSYGLEEQCKGVYGTMINEGEDWVDIMDSDFLTHHCRVVEE